jgi:peptide/nickel transport system permease protein
VIVGLFASILATIISLIIGIVSGYIGGRLDLIVQRGVDTIMCLPSLILLMVLISIIGPGMWQVIVVLGLRWGIVGSRIIRSAVIGIKENVYVGAAKAIGASTWKILVRHILPNIMAPTIILFTIRVPNVILVEASLSFLGFGIPPPFPSWGGMLSGAGRTYMLRAPWMALWPGLALATVVYGINMFGDAIRDLLDPRLRGGAGRYGVKAKSKAEKTVPAGEN